MKAMTLREIADAVHGVLNDKTYAHLEIKDVYTDTRHNVAGALFVPLRGDNFDGHAYLADAFTGGAAAALTDVYSDLNQPLIRVSNTRKALLDLAGHYRRKFNASVVAVTGSAGKTTTKELIACVLSEKFRVLKTEGNLNNEIGVPKMLFRLTDDVEIAVLEMGMSGFGELHRIARAAQPDMAVIVNVGDAHIENLGSREGILKAKAEVLDFLPPCAPILLNGADEWLAALRGTRQNICFYGVDVYASHIEKLGLAGVRFVCHGGGQEFPVMVPLPGDHMVSNALAAAAAGLAFDLTGAEIAAGIAKFVPAAMRMQVNQSISGATVIDDSYNANPDAMRAALDVLAAEKGRRVAVLGDMLELGPHSARLHEEVGRYAAGLGLDAIVCIGPESQKMADGATAAGGNVLYFETREAFLAKAHDVLANGGTILVKASRGMGFEKITESLRNA